MRMDQSYSRCCWFIEAFRRWIERQQRVSGTGEGFVRGQTSAVIMDGNEHYGDDFESHVDPIDDNKRFLTLTIWISLISQLKWLIFKSAAQSFLQRRQIESAVDDSATTASLEAGCRGSTLQRFNTKESIFVKFTFEDIVVCLYVYVSRIGMWQRESKENISSSATA